MNDDKLASILRGLKRMRDELRDRNENGNWGSLDSYKGELRGFEAAVDYVEKRMKKNKRSEYRSKIKQQKMNIELIDYEIEELYEIQQLHDEIQQLKTRKDVRDE